MFYGNKECVSCRNYTKHKKACVVCNQYLNRWEPIEKEFPKEKEYRVYMDGNQWCAVNQDFENIQESLCGFNKNPITALTLLRELERDE